MATRLGVLLYGLVSYIIFLATFVYAIGFIGGFAVPKTLDGPPIRPFIPSLLIDMALLGLFAIQHSVMARPGFKRWWTTIIPTAMERSTYVLLSSVALIILFYYWQPLGGTVWMVTNKTLAGIIYGVFACGWLLVLVSTFLINHFDLFGLRQVWLYFLDKPYTPLPFTTPSLYKFVRHPLYVGWFIAFWAIPTMSTTHLVFALVTTAYILIAIRFEERDLVQALPGYEAYRDNVPMLIPKVRGRSS